MTADPSLETMAVRWKWHNIFQALNEEDHPLECCTQGEYFFHKQRRNKAKSAYTEERKLSDSITHRPALKEQLNFLSGKRQLF